MAFIGVAADPRFVAGLCAMPRAHAMRDIFEVHQLPEGSRERDLVARLGLDGSPT